jgi:glucosyl-3-phosphoglycerate synthase
VTVRRPGHDGGVPIRRIDHRGLDVVALTEAKGRRTTSVCLPARNEAGTVGEIVTRIAEHPLVDEVVVVDDHSDDGTGDVALAAGARVVRAAEVLTAYGDGPGKGQALWKAVASSTGDVVAFCDADLWDFQPHFVTGLLGPLLLDPSLGFLKAYYLRPTDGAPRGGGRVTELVARPLLHLLFPHLADMVQPLAGEFAARRDVFEELPFVEGYGVDIGLVIDAAERCGIEGMAQVDLGTRKHRNRPLDDLGPMATVVLMTMLRRAGIDRLPDEVLLDRIDLPVAPVHWGERPRLVDVPEYHRL